MSRSYAATSLSVNSLRRTALGFLINGYCFGRRFFTRGSTRPFRDGLTRITDRSWSPSATTSFVGWVSTSNPSKLGLDPAYADCLI
jgi:hypothetical protein